MEDNARQGFSTTWEDWAPIDPPKATAKKKEKTAWKLPSEFPYARRYTVDGVDYWVGGYALVVDRPFQGKSLKPTGSGRVMVDRAGRFLRIPRDRLCLAADCPKLYRFEDLYKVTGEGSIVVQATPAEVDDLNLGLTVLPEEMEPVA